MNRPSTPISAAIRGAAADWRGQRDAGLSEAQEAEFAVWLEADERHAAAFAEIEETWNTLARLRSERPRSGEPNPDLLQPAGIVEFPALPRARWRRRAFAAAAAAAAIALVALAPWRRAASGPATPTATVATAGVKKIALDDGSVVQLNTGAHVEVNYSAAERRVHLLHGEAHFTVTKNAGRPFIVDVRGIAVRALGTAFNVRCESTTVEVLVTEGRVRVDAPPVAVAAPVAAEPAFVGAGEKVVVPAAAATSNAPLLVVQVPAAEIEQSLAWHDLRLKFMDVTLDEAVTEFNRHNQHRLVIADRELGRRRFGGTFLPESYDAFVRLLETDFDVVAERRPGETILRKGR